MDKRSSYIRRLAADCGMGGLSKLFKRQASGGKRAKQL